MVCWQAKGVKKTDTASVGLWDRGALINSSLNRLFIASPASDEQFAINYIKF